MSAKISQYQQNSDSVSLKKIDGEAFTIVKVEDSNYDDNGRVTEGVKITTKENFTIDGEEHNKFHTSRMAIVQTLRNEELQKDLSNGKTIGPVKCQSVKSKKGGKDYFTLVDA